MWVMDRLLADHAELKKKYDTLLEDYQKLVHKYEELSAGHRNRHGTDCYLLRSHEGSDNK
jgi:hypothetical protein